MEPKTIDRTKQDLATTWLKWNGSRATEKQIEKTCNQLTIQQLQKLCNDRSI